MEVEEDDKPPSGTPCVVCRTMGHFCAASHYVGKTDNGICTPCKECRNCFQVQVTKTEQQEEADMVADSVRAEILAADLLESDVSIARRVGLSAQYVGRIRTKAGIYPESKERCAVPGCQYSASLGFSYCRTRHAKELKDEKYQIEVVAPRKEKLKQRRKHIESPDGHPARLPRGRPLKYLSPVLDSEPAQKEEKEKEKEVPVPQSDYAVLLPPPTSKSTAYDLVIEDMEQELSIIEERRMELGALLNVLRARRGKES